MAPAISPEKDCTAPHGRQRIGVARVDFDRSLERVLRLIVFGARKKNAAKRAVSVGLVGRQRDRFARFIGAARELAIGELGPAQNRHASRAHRPAGPALLA